MLLGHQPVCAVEIDEHCQQVLSARHKDGCVPWFPIFSDVKEFDGRPWAGCVDLVAGGFPCQDISIAGRGAGITGERSGLWSEMARIVGEVRPRYVFVENSPVLTSRGLGRVLWDLATLGYDTEWGVLGAADLGAPHRRDRIWIVADTTSISQRKPPDETIAIANGWNPRHESGLGGEHVHSVSHANSIAVQGVEPAPQTRRHKRQAGFHYREGSFPTWPDDPAETPESGLGRVADGVPNRLDRLKALGNGQVPRVAAAAFAELIGRLTTGST